MMSLVTDVGADDAKVVIYDENFRVEILDRRTRQPTHGHDYPNQLDRPILWIGWIAKSSGPSAENTIIERI